MESEEEIVSKISRRRRQILIHSYIYYRLDESIISDSTWSKWAVELHKLQKEYPELADAACYADAFKNFDPSTGYDLPLNDPWVMKKGNYILSLERRIQYGKRKKV